MTRWGGAIVLVAALAGSALVAGCGDDEPVQVNTVPTTTTPAPLTRQAFVEQADAICAEANAAIVNLTSGTVSGGDSFVAEQEHGITRSQLDSLRSLGDPEGDTGELERFLSALEAVEAALRNRLNAIEQADDAALAQAQSDLEAARADAEAAAIAFGLDQCAQPAETSSTDGTTTTPATTTATTPATTTATTPVTTTTSGGTGTGAGGTGTGTGTGTGGGGTGGGGTGGVSP